MCHAEVSVRAPAAAHTDGAQEVSIAMTALCSACCVASPGSEKQKQAPGLPPCPQQGTQAGADSIIWVGRSVLACA